MRLDPSPDTPSQNLYSFFKTWAVKPSNIYSHVVPATSKAYIYIATAWDCEDEDGKVEREWGDGIYDVLAYATTRSGWGAYLVEGSDGPMWITARRHKNLFMRLMSCKTGRLRLLRGGFWEERDKAVNGNYVKEVSPLHVDYADHVDLKFLRRDPRRLPSRYSASK